jgi:hypothetical protein
MIGEQGNGFWTQFLGGLLLFVAGLMVRPLYDRLIGLPRRVRRAARDISRIWTDHTIWVDRHHQAFLTEAARADEKAAERGVYGSGAWLRAIESLRTKSLNELQDNQRATLRAMEDAAADFGPLERLWAQG